MNKNAIEDVVAERDRQRNHYPWNESHDDQYTDAELIRAAVCYAAASVRCTGVKSIEDISDALPSGTWPWQASWWKPTTPRRNLVKAAALLIAEIERIDRKEDQQRPEPDAFKY